MKFDAIIIGAGKGTRMNSDLPKVMHKIGGKPLLQHVIDTARQTGADNIMAVIGHQAEHVKNNIQGDDIKWLLQREQLGTGHAVQQALDYIVDDKLALILYGDVPLISVGTLHNLLRHASQSGFGLLTAVLAEPAGYGRIVRGAHDNVLRIVEHKDANANELAIREINTGIMAVRGEALQRYLRGLANDNSQGEYYLTDIVEMAVADGVEVRAVISENPYETTGINDRVQQAQMERYYQQNQVLALMRGGVSVADPARVDIRGKVECGKDVFIDVNAVFVGKVTLGNNVTIGPNCLIQHSSIGADTKVLANTVIENAVVGKHCNIGPFSRLRPDAYLKGDNNVGNFVEVKKSTVGRGSKLNHLSYIGDSTIGENCNVGAGTITCNYDGAYKHQTIIGDNVFIGSDTQLVAPVAIADNVTIGAGTTVTSDVKGESKEELLVISRVKQKIIKGWRRPKK